MRYDLTLLPGERLLWAGLRGQPALPGGAAGVRIAYVWFLLCFFVGAPGVTMLFIPDTRLYAIGVVALIVAGIVYYRRWRKRPCIFITTQRLVDRGLFGATSVGLAEIASYRRRIDKYYYRGTTTEVATNKLEIATRRGVVKVGPVREYEEVAAFLDGILSRDIDPSAMRSLDGGAAAAEKREDVFVAIENRTEGDVYGPLFIGERGLLRFTSKLPIGFEGLLLTALAKPGPVEELERRAIFFGRRPDAGHVLLVERDKVRLEVEGRTLTIEMKERSELIELSAEDAERARRFLTARATASAVS